LSENGWRLRERFRGLETTAWIDDGGETVREEGPMDLVLRREGREAAVSTGWTTESALDLMSTVAVPVARPISNPRTRASLRLRLRGISMDEVPVDDEQRRDGSELTIRRQPLRPADSYPLPYRGEEHAADLEPTLFLQSDHPRIRRLADEILGGERDALAATKRLNDWVYAFLDKVPTVSLPNALQVLDMGAGDCNEHAVLLAALARAAGLPARVIAGAVYLDQAFVYHAWVEVWLGRWVAVDPALHQLPADATHIKFVIGGPEEHFAMMAVIGRLQVDVLADVPPRLP
jgi:transglutaminase-like putative cysteine protease